MPLGTIGSSLPSFPYFSIDCQTLKTLQGKETWAANEGAYIIRTETCAKRRFRQRRANLSDSSAGWSPLPQAVRRLLQTHRRLCKAKFRQRRTNPLDSSAGWSRLQDAAVARLLQTHRNLRKAPFPATPRESFRFQRGLVAPAGRCSGATASTYVTDFAVRVDEVSRNFNFIRSCSRNFCVCRICQWIGPRFQLKAGANMSFPEGLIIRPASCRTRGARRRPSERRRTVRVQHPGTDAAEKHSGSRP